MMAFKVLNMVRPCRVNNFRIMQHVRRNLQVSETGLKSVMASSTMVVKRGLHDSEYKLVYEGPLSTTVKYVKRFSLATCAVSLIGSPFLLIYGKASVPLAGKIGLAAIVLLMGTTTTFILHWFTRVYVHRMFYNPNSKSFAVETMNVFARKKMSYFPAEHVEYPTSESAFSTFRAEGKNFFIHMELKEAELAMDYIKEKNLDELPKN